MLKIKNMPSTPIEGLYVVYRVVDGENWYYSSTKDITTACEMLHVLGDNAYIIEIINAKPTF